MALIQYILTVNLMIVVNGFSLNWPLSYLPKLNITRMNTVLVMAMEPIAGTLAAILQSALVNRIGRKRMMQWAVLPYILGWLITGFTTTLPALCIGRFVAGFASGITYSTIRIYLSEISPMKYRGSVICSESVAIVLGTMLLYVQELYLSIPQQAMVSVTLILISGLLLFWIPETPYYLLLRGDYQTAEKSLVKLRKTKDIDEEMKGIIHLTEYDLTINNKFADIILVPANRKAMVIVITMTLVSTFTGDNVISLYGESIFDALDTNFTGRYWLVAMECLHLSSTLVTLTFVNIVGRRKLLLLSTSGNCLSTLALSIYLCLYYYGLSVKSFSWLAHIIVFLYTIFHSMGLSFLNATIIAELFPSSLKPKAYAVSGIITNIYFIFSIEVFQTLWLNFGLQTVFFVFSMFNVVAFIYVAYLIPETKNKTVEEVHNILASSFYVSDVREYIKTVQNMPKY